MDLESDDEALKKLRALLLAASKATHHVRAGSFTEADVKVVEKTQREKARYEAGCDVVLFLLRKDRLSPGSAETNSFFFLFSRTTCIQKISGAVNNAIEFTPGAKVILHQFFSFPSIAIRHPLT